MKFSVVRDGENILTFKDFENYKDKGEISHFIVELELARMELLGLWEDIEDNTG